MSDMQTKVCRVCRTEKPLEEYYAKPGNRDGRDNRCIDCKRAYDRGEHRANTVPADPRKRLMATEPYTHFRDCRSCPHMERCRDRLANRRWILCEIPDWNDLVRSSGNMVAV